MKQQLAVDLEMSNEMSKYCNTFEQGKNIQRTMLRRQFGKPIDLKKIFVLMHKKLL